MATLPKTPSSGSSAERKLPTPISSANTVPVTVDNFVRAETDWAFSNVLRDQDAFGKFYHFRELAPLDKQAVPRANRDTLYSTAVFDLDAAPVTITMPDAGKRFMTMMVINEDHYVYSVTYTAGVYTLSRDKVGTRYVLVALRTLVDPSNPKDVEQVTALQDAVKVDQKNPGRFEVPNWDQESQKKIREALKTLGASMPDSKHAFGAKGEVDPVRHLIVTAMAWGGNPEKDAIYLNFTPSKNDGKTIYQLNVGSVPVDAFWSITVYNAEGYLQANSQNHYSLNNITAEKGADGSIAVQFGGCDDKAANCLPIMPGWNYLVRLYRPRPEILNGMWKFPEALIKS
jgi:hypothetical protein